MTDTGIISNPLVLQDIVLSLINHMPLENLPLHNLFVISFLLGLFSAF